eukprot:5335199-Alexandrium_andersonii.AAC.1
MRVPCRSPFLRARRQLLWRAARTPMDGARMSLVPLTLRNPGEETSSLDHSRVSSHGLSVETTGC